MPKMRVKQIYQEGASADQIVTFGTSIWEPDDRPIFGRLLYSGESLSQSNTTSTSWQQKLRITTPSVPAGDYFLDVDFQWMQSNSGEDNDVQVQLDDTTNLWDIEMRYFGVTTGLWHSAGCFAFVTLTAASHTFDLDYRTSSGGSAYIREVKMAVWSSD